MFSTRNFTDKCYSKRLEHVTRNLESFLNATSKELGKIFLKNQNFGKYLSKLISSKSYKTNTQFFITKATSSKYRNRTEEKRFFPSVRRFKHLYDK